MISSGNTASSHSGLIPLKTAYKIEGNCSGRSRVRRILLTFIQLLLLTVFARNLVHAHKFRTIQKTARYFFLYNWQSRDQASVNVPCRFQEHWKQWRLVNWASNITNFLPRFCVYDRASVLIFHCLAMASFDYTTFHYIYTVHTYPLFKRHRI